MPVVSMPTSFNISPRDREGAPSRFLLICWYNTTLQSLLASGQKAAQALVQPGGQVDNKTLTETEAREKIEQQFPFPDKTDKNQGILSASLS